MICCFVRLWENHVRLKKLKSLKFLISLHQIQFFVDFHLLWRCMQKKIIWKDKPKAKEVLKITLPRCKTNWMKFSWNDLIEFFIMIALRYSSFDIQVAFLVHGTTFHFSQCPFDSLHFCWWFFFATRVSLKEQPRQAPFIHFS